MPSLAGPGSISVVVTAASQIKSNEPGDYMVVYGAVLVGMAITILSAAAIPLYIITREATLHLVELCPPEPITTLLDREELYQKPPRRCGVRCSARLGGVAGRLRYLDSGEVRRQEGIGRLLAIAACQPPERGRRRTAASSGCSVTRGAVPRSTRPGGRAPPPRRVG